MIQSPHQIEVALQFQDPASECSVNLETVFERTVFGMAIADVEGQLVRVNNAFCELLGLTEKELASTNLRQLTHRDDLSESVTRFQQLVAGEITNYQIEKRFVRKDKQSVWALLSVCRIESGDGGMPFFAAQIQDISKRRDAEEALQQNEALFRSIGENAGDLILVMDFPSLITQYASPTYEKILGYPRDELYQSMEIVHPDDRELIRRELERMVRSGGNSSILQLRVRDRAGKYHFCEAHGCAVRAADGSIERMVVISRVTDERVRAQQELQDRENQLQSLLDSTGEAIYGLDMQGKGTFCNRSFLQLTGYERDSEVLGQRIHDLIHHSRTDGTPYFVEDCPIHHGLLTGSKIHLSDEIVWKRDGSCFPAEYWSYPVYRNGALVGGVVTFFDIRERKAAQDALRAAHEAAEMFINSVPSILIAIDAEGRITRWNQTAAETFGLTKDQMLGQPLVACGIHWLHSDMAAEVTSWCTQKVNRRYDNFSFERDGEKRRLGLTVDWVMSPEKQNNELLIIGSDVTERRTLEVQLRQAQKLEAIGQLAAGIAHEINTPTQYVGDNTNFLKESWISIAPLLAEMRALRAEAGNGGVRAETLRKFDEVWEAADLLYLEAEVPRAIEQSLDGIQRVAKIVRAMKEFSHPGTEEKRPVDLNKAIETTVTVARNEWKYVAELVTNLDPVLQMVPAHAGEFNQVILNLIINAAHAIKQVVGDGSQRKGRITVVTRHEGDWAEIQIQDTGAGIPEAIRSRIFEPF
ncbi:MAG TPA: PAS domain S-box protein, partial [Terriglobales bacterium]|nr:PAS domain S-box protein [Terriglobales bacterium]